MCYECGKECKETLSGMSMIFESKGFRMGTSEADAGKVFCGVPCMMRCLRKCAYSMIRLFGEE